MLMPFFRLAIRRGRTVLLMALSVSAAFPAIGGTMAGQAANAVATSATASVGGDGQAIPGWWCRATYPAPTSRLAAISCSPHAHTPIR